MSVNPLRSAISDIYISAEEAVKCGITKEVFKRAAVDIYSNSEGLMLLAEQLYDLQKGRYKPKP